MRAGARSSSHSPDILTSLWYGLSRFRIRDSASAFLSFTARPLLDHLTDSEETAYLRHLSERWIELFLKLGSAQRPYLLFGARRRAPAR